MKKFTHVLFVRSVCAMQKMKLSFELLVKLT